MLVGSVGGQMLLYISTSLASKSLTCPNHQGRFIPGTVTYIRLKTKATRKERTKEISSAHVQLLLGPKPET